MVGVCTLTTRWLAGELAGAPGVAIAAPLMTANLGIEELVRSVLRDRQVRVLLLCGRDSPLFRPGQSLLALARNGVRDLDGRIIGARGYQPYLRGLPLADVEAFRSLVRVVDLRDVQAPAVLREQIATCARHFGEVPASGPGPRWPRPSRPGFEQLRPGGHRKPIRTAGEGFFVVSTDPGRRELIVRHYHENYTPAHEMRGHRAEPMVLGILRAGLIREQSHAAYLGAELTKAETALRLGLDYVQDIPLRRNPVVAARRMRKVPALESVEDFTRFIEQLIGHTGPELEPDLPIAEQTGLSSMQLIELAISLEQECAIELPDDIDLRQTSPARLFAARSPASDGGLTYG